MSRLLLLLALALVASLRSAAGLELIIELPGEEAPADWLPPGLSPRNHFLHVVRNEDPELPGRGLPAADLPLQIIQVRWDGSEPKVSHLVVLGGDPRERQAMVYTWQPVVDELGFPTIWVFYGARAFRDELGRLQFDCRLQPPIGEDVAGWSPDSFAVAGDRVSVMDDRGATAEGEVVRVYRPGHPHPADGLDYWAMRRVIRCYMTGVL